MSEKGFRYVYGPVPSRRLGRSLGVDLVPFKVCTFDCVYCQLGRTTIKTLERKEYVSAADVLDEVKRKLAEEDNPNYITFAGSGEPTLNSRIGDLILRIKDLTDIQVAVLTNGSLLCTKEVQDDLMAADLVIPSLDAGDEQLFRYVNRPHENISFDRLVDGLVDFTRRFPGQVWLEILLLEGVTSMPSQEPSEISAFSESREEDVLALLRRRPCTSEDVAEGLGIHIAEALKRLNALTAIGTVSSTISGGRNFYTATGGKSPSGAPGNKQDK